MIKLTSRQTNIIDILLGQTRPISIENLANQLNVSDRTVRYDLKDVEYWLKQKSINLSKKPNVGIWINLSDIDRNKVKEEVNIVAPYEHVLTMKERQDIIILFLLLSDIPVSSQYIADKIEISRNTVISDLKNIKQQLITYNVELKSRPKIGFYVVGEELYIRKLISSLVLVYIHGNELFDMNYTSDSINDKSIALRFICSSCKDIKIADIKSAIKECKKIYDFWIPDNSYKALLIDIMILIKRVKAKKHIEFSRVKKTTMKELEEYKVAKVIASYLSSFYEIDLSEDEIVYLTYCLFSNDFKLKNSKPSINEKDKYLLEEAVEQMIKSAEKHIQLNSENIEKLRQDLLVHMRLTIKKYKVNAENNNPLLGEIKETYSEEFVIAKDMIKGFLSVIDIKLGEDETGYIAIILAANIEEKKKQCTKALIVCSTGKGSAKILYQRIINTIPELHILGTFSVFELEDYPDILKHADVIISTVYFKTEDKPLIKVSPFVLGKDISKIKSFIYGGKRGIYNKEAQQEEHILDRLMETVEKYIQADKREKVRLELNNNLNSISKSFTSISNELESLEKYSEKTAMTIIEMGEMLNELYEKGTIDSKDKNLFAIVIHIVMAIPRWKSGDYAAEINTGKYKSENIEMFNIINKHLSYISGKYNLNVPESETVVLMRYLI